FFFFFFQAEDGIRDKLVTGVQTCALPISAPAVTKRPRLVSRLPGLFENAVVTSSPLFLPCATSSRKRSFFDRRSNTKRRGCEEEIGRASCRERVKSWVGAGWRTRKEERIE